MAVVDAIDPETDDTGWVMETSPWVLSDEGMGYDIIDEPLLLNIVMGWWNKENGGTIEVSTLLSMGMKGSNNIDHTPNQI